MLNLYVKSVIPNEDTFSGKEIPVEPIPHDNKTGDVEFTRNYTFE